MDYRHGWEQRLLDEWSATHNAAHVDFLGYRDTGSIGVTQYIVRDCGVWLGVAVSSGYHGYWTKSILWHEFCCCKAVQKGRLWKGKKRAFGTYIRHPGLCIGWSLAPFAGHELRRGNTPAYKPTR